MQIREVHPRVLQPEDMNANARNVRKSKDYPSRESRSVESRVDAARARKEGHDAPNR